MSSIQGSVGHQESACLHQIGLPSLDEVVRDVARKVDEAVQKSFLSLEPQSPLEKPVKLNTFVAQIRRNEFCQFIRRQVREGRVEKNAKTLKLDVAKQLVADCNLEIQPVGLQRKFKKCMEKEGGFDKFWEKVNKSKIDQT